MHCRSRRGSSSSSTEARFALGAGLALSLVLTVGCESSDADDDSPEPAGGTTTTAGQGGGSAAGGQAGTQAVAGRAGSGNGASSSVGGSPAQAGTSAGGRGGTGVAGTEASSGAPASGAAGDAAGAGNGGSSAGTDSGGSGSGGEAGTAGGSSAPEVHYVGRVDTSDPNAARFAWSGTGAAVRFNGSSVSVELGGGQEYTVVVDGVVGPKLTATDGVNILAQGLATSEHTVELYRRTEAAEGEAEIRGFDFGGGQLLAPPPVTRRLEFVGDSITCGYGIEGANMDCGFTPQTENQYLAYAALTARSLQAELSSVAWSGKGVVCNYGDDASSCTNPFPTYYDRILPNDADSQWDFSRFVPDAVVVNLGTNDFSTNSDPEQPVFESAYRELLERIREHYPNAHILCTNGPMLSGDDLVKVRLYLENVVMTLDDPKISTFQIAPQDGSDGYGCDWHPSVARQEKMATAATAAIKAALGW